MDDSRELAQTEAIVARVQALAAEVGELQIDSREAYEAAATYSVRLREYRKQVEQFFRPMRVQAQAALDAVRERMRAVLDPIATAERVLDQKLLAWRTAEAARQAERAQAARAGADPCDLEGAIAREAEIAVATPPPPSVKGFGTRTVWAWELEDIGALVRAAAADSRWLPLLSPNEAAIGALVRAGQGQGIPGVRVFQRDVVVKRVGG